MLPPGNVLHELINLPAYWLKLAQVDVGSMRHTRIAYGDHHRQYVLFIPPDRPSSLQDKLVIYFHGGGWKFGRPERFKASVIAIHQAGYPIVLPSHRRIPHYNYYDMRRDLDQILLCICRIQQEHGWSDQRMVVGGMSAGGNLAALLCYDHDSLDRLGIPPSVFAGLLVCGAPLDLEHMPDSPLLRAFAGSRGSAQFQAANPAFHLKKHRPDTPVFCVHGKSDGLVPYRAADAFAATLREIRPGRIQFGTTRTGTHLEAAAWGHDNKPLKNEILHWLKNL